MSFKETYILNQDLSDCYGAKVYSLSVLHSVCSSLCDYNPCLVVRYKDNQFLRELVTDILNSPSEFSMRRQASPKAILEVEDLIGNCPKCSAQIFIKNPFSD
jgi:hypothetical protein